MALLQVYRNGQKFKELMLQPGKEWIVGRSTSCDLVLEGEQGVSRQHLKFAFADGRWTVEVLSRYGELYQDGKKISLISLESGAKFEVPPFEFVFENSSETAAITESASLGFEQGDGGSFSSGDRTFVGQLVLQPFLRISNEQEDTVQIFQLEGHAWVAGRDVSCALFIDNPKFSRRHFEIRFEEGAYLMKDLGSSNGTLLNNEPVSTVSWTQIKSGDVITVVDWNLHFELRDSSYEAKLMEIPQDLQLPMEYPSDVNPNAVEIFSPGISSSPPPPPPHADPIPEKKKINFVRLLIGVLVVGGALAYLFQDNGAPAPSAQGPAKPASGNPFEKLTPQQQQYVKDTYRLADRLFKEGRYEMARQEVTKIHQLVPSFEESKNLEKLADIAIQTQLEQAKAEVREKEKAEMEEKIQKVVADCRKKVSSRVEMKTIDDCLMPIISLNPDHPSILALKAEVDQIISERAAREEKQSEYLGLVRRQKNLYDKASSLYGGGKPLEAIQAFETVVQSKLPDPKNFKGEAKRQIASIQKELTDKQAELEKEADQSYKKGDLKVSIVTLQKALAINPENETLKGRVNSMLGELKKQMQTLYQEGVLEESVGEVETAKAKWKKIIDTSLPEEDYFKKAKMKLKKYGVD